jgi:hypothetical protein
MPDEFRSQLVALLRGDQAHMPFDEAVADFPESAINERAPNVEYTAWHLVEHLRLTQVDMLDYILDPVGYRAPEWPADYWPERAATTDAAGFRRSCDQFIADRQRLEEVVLDESRDLAAPLENTPGHSTLRCVMIIGNHNSYHLGELGAMRQVTGSWGAGHR